MHACILKTILVNLKDFETTSSPKACHVIILIDVHTTWSNFRLISRDQTLGPNVSQKHIFK